MISARRTFWGVLLVAAVADALLAPFFPQFFAQSFGDRSWSTPALYIMVCRVAVALGMPLWARMAQRTSPVKLLAVAQGAAGVLGLLSSQARDVRTFMILAFLTEACRSSYLLVYALLVRCTPEEKRGVAIGWVVVVVNLAAMLSAVVAGLMLERLGARSAVILAAVADFVQMAILLWGFKGAVGATLEDEPAGEKSGGDAGLLLLCAIAFLSAFGVVLLRPYFTEYVAQAVAPGLPLWVLGAIFVIPNAMALAVLPLAERVTVSARPHLLLIIAFGSLAAGALLQGFSRSVLALGAARAVYGFSLALTDVTVDFAVLSSARDALGRFGYVSASQSVAIIFAPLAAGYVADHHGFRALFAFAAVVALLAAAVSMRLRPATPVCTEQRT
ncbi:Siderophore related permease [Minicystis rosea]|nr:Siderophore related permease [Minicystis rosea]